jgi:hypothetical protein
MLTEIVLTGGLAVAILGVLEAGSQRWRRRSRSWEGIAAVREAMRGSESGAVRAEFRQSGIVPPHRRRPVGFTWSD